MRPQTQGIPEIFNTLPRVPPNVFKTQPDITRSGPPIIHRPEPVPVEESIEEKVVPEIELKLKDNEELAPLTLIVKLPPIYQYEVRVFKVDENVHGIDPLKLFEKKEVEDLLQSSIISPAPEFTIHPLEPNEIILDMKTVNLKCDKGTKADYI